MGSYAQALQYKQALSDEELQGKISELVDNRKAIQAKLPTLLDEKGNPTPQYNEAITALTQNSKDLREIYHPDKNPSAISRYGHLLTDALHITNAAQREKEQAAKQTALATGDQRTAQGLAAAAPLSPSILAGQETQAQIDRQNSVRDANIKWLKEHGAPQEVIEQATAIQGGVPLSRGTKAVGQPYQDSNDKKWYQRYVNADGTDSRNEIAGYTPPAPKPPSGLEASLIRALYGDTPTAAQIKSGISEYRELNTPVRTSTGQVLVYDNDGKPHVFERTTTSGAHFPGATTPSSNASGPQTPSASGTNSASLSKSKTSSRTPKTPKSPIGPALEGFTRPTPVVTKAQQDVVAAAKIANLGKQALASHEAVQQRQLALAMIRGMAGRVNMQEFQQYTTKMGVENTIEGLIKGLESGQLPDGIVQELVHAANANMIASQDALKMALSGNAGMSGETSDTPKHKIKIGEKMYTYNGTGDTADLNSYTEVKQ